jgi:sulfite dehydrogenase (quinone) subunit SoeC
MHPAPSVITFTTLSGAGFALLALVAVWPETAHPEYGWIGLFTGFALSVGGLISSTFHLRHPERAWRAFSQWQSSWLAREGVLAVAALVVIGLFGLFWLLFDSVWMVFGLAGAALAIATVYATSMIYAQLKTVPAWHTELTPACYLLFAAAGGFIALVAIRGFVGLDATAATVVAIAVTAVAWIVKFFWWKRYDLLESESTAATATGLGVFGRVRLLEAPHTGSNYLMKEMGFRIARKHAAKLRLIAVAAGCVLTILLLLAGLATEAFLGFGILALASYFLGTIVERWLFFAEARHVVNAYYDRASS